MGIATRVQTSNSKYLKVETYKAKVGFLNREAHGEQFLPGIPNEITLQHILTKVSWKDTHMLSFVNPFWRYAIQSHHVYNTRVQVNSAETLDLAVYKLKFGVDTIVGLQLVSVTGDCVVKLPPIPYLKRPGLPINCRCAALDGKIYIFGGKAKAARFCSNRVYMLDVAGFRQWEECARMQHGRQDFECGVLDGKIYVFDDRSLGAQVYDPEKNTWSMVTAKISLHSSPDEALVDEKVVSLQRLNHVNFLW